MQALKIQEPQVLLLYPLAPLEHQCLLERKSIKSLSFDGIGAGLEGTLQKKLHIEAIQNCI